MKERRRKRETTPEKGIYRGNSPAYVSMECICPKSHHSPLNHTALALSDIGSFWKLFLKMVVVCYFLIWCLTPTGMPPHPMSPSPFGTFKDEIKCVIGINILMGIHRLPSLIDYWSSDSALRVPYITSKMPRNRFEQLCKYMYFSDPNSANVTDKWHKVRPFIKILQENSLNYLTHGKPSQWMRLRYNLTVSYCGSSICPKKQ